MPAHRVRTDQGPGTVLDEPQSSVVGPVCTVQLDDLDADPVEGRPPGQRQYVVAHLTRID